MVGLGDFDGGIFFSWATDVSVDGSVVVGFGNGADRGRAFRWTHADGLVPILHADPDAETCANAVSSDGTIIAGSFSLGTSGEAFRWTSEDGLVPLGRLRVGRSYSHAFDISADGSVIVGSSDSALGLEACRWTDAEGLVALGDLEGGHFRSLARAVSADGSVIVGHGTTELGAAAFIWDAEHGMQNLREVLINDFGLDLTGWSLREAKGISDDGGTIVGWGKNPDGRTEGWVVRIVNDQDGDGIGCRPRRLHRPRGRSTERGGRAGWAAGEGRAAVDGHRRRSRVGATFESRARQTHRVHQLGRSSTQEDPRGGRGYADRVCRQRARAVAVTPLVPGQVFIACLLPPDAAVPERTRGKYGRVLAYVFLDRGGRMFNEMLFEDGYAYADLRFKHPYFQQFKAIEKRARKSGIGLWKHVTLEHMPQWKQRFERARTVSGG